jgi:small GTP-binding protein
MRPIKYNIKRLQHITNQEEQMKGYSTDKIRNIVLLGHGSTGKTTFLEAGLLNTKVISRLGKVEDGNTVSDYEKMEIEKGYTINQTLVPVEFKGTKLNFIDTPGFFDFAGEARAALSTGATAIIMVDASSGIQVGTEKAWDLVKEYNAPAFFVISKTEIGRKSKRNDVTAILAEGSSDFFRYIDVVFVVIDVFYVIACTRIIIIVIPILFIANVNFLATAACSKFDDALFSVLVVEDELQVVSL